MLASWADRESPLDSVIIAASVASALALFSGGVVGGEMIKKGSGHSRCVVDGCQAVKHFHDCCVVAVLKGGQGISQICPINQRSP